jgi:hypothetical protein
MPNFDVLIDGGDEVPWVDAASLSPQAPSRLNPDPEHLPSYRRILVSFGLANFEVHAVVGGVEAPLDAALGGDLFTAAWVEWSGPFPPAIVQPAGQTSVCQIEVSTLHEGHFCLSVSRANGGGVLVHFDVEGP